jgi:hypothetical protein
MSPAVDVASGDSRAVVCLALPAIVPVQEVTHHFVQHLQTSVAPHCVGPLAVARSALVPGKQATAVADAIAAGLAPLLPLKFSCGCFRTDAAAIPGLTNSGFMRIFE